MRVRLRAPCAPVRWHPAEKMIADLQHSQGYCSKSKGIGAVLSVRRAAVAGASAAGAVHWGRVGPGDWAGHLRCIFPTICMGVNSLHDAQLNRMATQDCRNNSMLAP